jgi:hypothetical protein
MKRWRQLSTLICATPVNHLRRTRNGFLSRIYFDRRCHDRRISRQVRNGSIWDHASSRRVIGSAIDHVSQQSAVIRRPMFVLLEMGKLCAAKKKAPNINDEWQSLPQLRASHNEERKLYDDHSQPQPLISLFISRAQSTSELKWRNFEGEKRANCLPEIAFCIIASRVV